MLKIEDDRNASQEEWDSLWKSTHTATYYHSREWAEIWQEYTKGRIRPVPKLILFSDGTQVLFPFSRQSYYGGIVKRYSLTGPPAMALPYYGNWLTEGALSDEHIGLLSKHLITGYKNLVWRLNPYDENSKKIFVNSRYTQRRRLVTYVIDLTKGEDYIYSRMTQSCRNQVKQGMRNNLNVSEAADIGEWKKYYEIYRDTLNRWGSKALYVLDWRIFEILFLRHNPNIKLWLVWYQNNPIAGGICFYSHRKITSWHISSLTEYHQLRPVNLLKFMIIKDGMNKQYSLFDMETAGGQKGLQKFKKSFGPEEIMCDMIVNWHPVIYYSKKIIPGSH
jgi:hypothetical protein